MTSRSPLSEQQRLALICETIRYCQRVRDLGMVRSAWSKALREPIFFMWERRRGSKKGAARFRSFGASGLVWGAREIVYDHAIPFIYVQNELLELREPTPEAVRDILDRRLISCIISRAEDQKLYQAGLAKKMPADWDGTDPLARYKEAEVRVEPNPSYLS